MTHVSLFTGIGGLDLAAEWAGFETILQVEMDDYANKVLEKHWPNVPRVRDIRNVNRETLAYAMFKRYWQDKEKCREQDISGTSNRFINSGTFEKRESRNENDYRTVTVISGGFPCQPFSVAGKRGGREDDRYLWPEMLRVIRELSPTWVVGENVAGLLFINDGMEIESIITDLEGEGYEVCPLHYPAVGVGAPHKRDRVFIVGYSKCTRGQSRKIYYGNDIEALRRRTTNTRFTTSQDVADTGRKHEPWNARGMESNETEWPSGKLSAEPSSAGLSRQWETEPDVGRVADGVPSRVDRLRCLGNAVVPQQAYPIFEAIAEAERVKKKLQGVEQ